MTTDVTVIEREEPRALAPSGMEAGTFALAAMSDGEFEARLAMLKKGRERIATIQRELMDRDVDYGTIPGTPKPSLFKPGAEKLCNLYGFVADFTADRVIGDGAAAPALAYTTRCELHLGDVAGPVVAVGYGSANSWERKHRYRTGERACPTCGALGTLLKSKRGKPEWFCWTKKGGCGAIFPMDAPAVVGQVVGDVENPDPWDLDTTLLKMAEKRAHVDATLRACAASGLFTQDVEDLPGREEPSEPTVVVSRPRTLRDAVRQVPDDEPPLPESETAEAPETVEGELVEAETAAAPEMNDEEARHAFAAATALIPREQVAETARKTFPGVASSRYTARHYRALADVLGVEL